MLVTHHKKLLLKKMCWSLIYSRIQFFLDAFFLLHQIQSQFPSNQSNISAAQATARPQGKYLKVWEQLKVFLVYFKMKSTTEFNYIFFASNNSQNEIVLIHSDSLMSWKIEAKVRCWLQTFVIIIFCLVIWLSSILMFYYLNIFSFYLIPTCSRMYKIKMFLD